MNLTHLRTCLSFSAYGNVSVDQWDFREEALPAEVHRTFVSMLNRVVSVPYVKKGFSPLEKFITATPQPPSSTSGANYTVQHGIHDDPESNGKTRCLSDALCTVHKYQNPSILKTSTISK